MTFERIILESVLITIFTGGVLVWCYNRWLSGLRESTFKKAASLLVLPASVASGAAHGAAMAHGWPVVSLLALVGLYFLHLKARTASLRRHRNRPWKRRRLDVSEPALRGPHYSALVRAGLWLLSPINGLARVELVERNLVPPRNNRPWHTSMGVPTVKPSSSMGVPPMKPQLPDISAVEHQLPLSSSMGVPPMEPRRSDAPAADPQPQLSSSMGVPPMEPQRPDISAVEHQLPLSSSMGVPPMEPQRSDATDVDQQPLLPQNLHGRDARATEVNPAPPAPDHQPLPPQNLHGRDARATMESPAPPASDQQPSTPAPSGLRILHLTDFHVHPTLRKQYFRAVVEAGLALSPDIVLLGGDYVSRRQWIGTAEHCLAPLREHPCVFAIRGNHDFWTRPSAHAAMLERTGAKLLTNSFTEAAPGLLLVGIEHPYVPITARRRDSLRRRIVLWRLANPRGFVLGLVHTPEAFPIARELGCALALAGHTHGGQLRLPFFGTTIAASTMGEPFVWGAGHLDSMETYVSNGIGAFFPLRFLCPPQVVLLTLQQG